MKALFNTIHYFLIAGVIAIGLLLLGTLMPIPGNFKVKIVKSGSMEPYIKTGGIVVIRPEADYVLGDVVTFGADTKTQIPTTHRIVDISGAGASRVFTTKGDANDAADPTQTRFSDIKGKVLFTVPFVGYILDFARKPVGFGLLVGVPAFAIILDEIGKIIREVRRLRRKKNRNQGDDEGGDKSVHGGSVNRGEQVASVREYTQRRILVDGITRPHAFADASVTQTRAARGKSSPKRMFIALLLVLGTFTGLSSVGSTSSYFADGEISVGNLLKAGAVFLTLSATEDSQARVASFSRSALLAPQSESEEYTEGTESFELTVGQGEGSLPLYYTAWGEFDADQPEGCEALILDVVSGSYSWDGAFTKFVLPATTTDETLDFTLTLPKENTIPKGAVCSGDIVFRAHPQGISTLISNIFTDEKKYSFTIHNYGESLETSEVLGDATSTPEIVLPSTESSAKESTTTPPTPEVLGGGGGGSTEVPPPVEPEATTTEPVAEEATSTPEVLPPADSSSTPVVVEPPADPAPVEVVVPPVDTASVPADTSTTP